MQSRRLPPRLPRVCCYRCSLVFDHPGDTDRHGQVQCPRCSAWTLSPLPKEPVVQVRQTVDGWHLDPDEVEVTATQAELMGGEVLRLFNEWVGKTIECLGIYFHPTYIDRLFAYPHTGGVKDKAGLGWWVYNRCGNPVSRSGEPGRCEYECACWKMPSRLKAYESTQEAEAKVSEP